ncbi:MAG: DUF4139 domain-containing protein [Planctomycetota bacterium]
MLWRNSGLMVCLVVGFVFDAKAADSRVDSVIVFRNQARVTRVVSVEAADDGKAIVLGDLPPSMRPDSLRWEPSDSIRVRSLNLKGTSEQADDGDNPEQGLDALIREAELQINVIEQDLETVERVLAFSVNKSQTQVDQGNIDVQSVTSILDYGIDRRRELAKELLAAEATLAELQDKEAKQELLEQAPLTGYQAELLVAVDQPGELRISYLVDRVQWSHQYTVHADTDNQDNVKVRLQLDSLISQATGEDWSDVTLQFCTGSADAVSNSPRLAPLRVRASTEGTSQSVIGQQALAGAGASESGVGWQRDLIDNMNAASRQLKELNEKLAAQRVLADDAAGGAVGEVYDLQGRVGIESGATQQRVNLATIDVESPVYRLVTPLLSSFAYLETEFTNPATIYLMSGDAQVIVNGRAIGKASIPNTPVGGKIAIGLGVDRQVRTRRELLSRVEKLQGGNQVDELHYRLVIANFHEAAIAVRLFDRLPITAGEGDVNVELTPEDKKMLSADGRYLRMQQPTGVLRWDLDVPARRFGSDAFDHEYRFSIERARDHRIVIDQTGASLRDDLQFKGSGGGGMGGGLGGGGTF